ncbi:hypothetical protein GCM10010441_29370 [Kitasatospora paracochleata]|uniref:Uncharacterized protein n=1 Tax=Kitasatospora paracochleata TaxID=58354 RepID=A0ABT1J8X6_9ACTN|nr:hypothetical protein [Kitasatospora paracochleata]MCP2313898.1 hypothetical protein [Kitasatospora paracochleata]
MSIPAMTTNATTACDNCGHRRWTLHVTVTTRSPAAGAVVVAVPAPPALELLVTCGTCAGWLDQKDPLHAAFYALLVDRFAQQQSVRPGRLHHLRRLLRRHTGARV